MNREMDGEERAVAGVAPVDRRAELRVAARLSRAGVVAEPLHAQMGGWGTSISRRHPLRCAYFPQPRTLGTGFGSGIEWGSVCLTVAPSPASVSRQRSGWYVLLDPASVLAWLRLVSGKRSSVRRRSPKRRRRSEPRTAGPLSRPADGPRPIHPQRPEGLVQHLPGQRGLLGPEALGLSRPGLPGVPGAIAALGTAPAAAAEPGGRRFPHAYGLMWLVLIVQNVIAQLVTGPLSQWNEMAFSLYYVLLFVISAVIVFHYQAMRELSGR